MTVIAAIAAEQEELQRWRRDLHAHPETAFEEWRTAEFVAATLTGCGIEVHRGIGRTGLVGVLRGRSDNGLRLGLRADMDALPMQEETEAPWQSQHDGKFHGCGHDGHTTMLLAAARHLARTRGFNGIVHFIFQPAEEGAGGGRAMVEDGLFTRFPCDEVYGLHNWPQLPAGTAAVRAGPMMAAADIFDITVVGRGCHAAMPHLGIDPVIVAAQLITALQTIVSRRVEPVEAAVITVTQVHAGSAYNVTPREARLAGTVRYLRPAVQALVRQEMEQLCRHLGAAFGATVTLRYRDGYPPTINHAEQADAFAAAAAAVFGADQVRRDLNPTMGAEDFAYMLNERPGAYLWLGSGDGEQPAGLHNPRFDFNDAVLPLGASLFVRLVEDRLGAVA